MFLSVDFTTQIFFIGVYKEVKAVDNIYTNSMVLALILMSQRSKCQSAVQITCDKKIINMYILVTYMKLLK